MCGESTTTSNQTQSSVGSTILPAWATGAGENLFNSANDYASSHPYQAYTGPTTASFGSEWGTAGNYLTNLLGKSNPGLDNSNDALRQVMGAAMPTATSSIQALMSPYTSGVLQPTLDAIGRNAAQNNNSLAASATMSGALGDSGWGVQKANNQRDTQQQIADSTAAAYDKAYNSAEGTKNTALQQVMSAASGMGGNATAQFGENSSIAQLLSSMGSTEQGANASGINTSIGVNRDNNNGQLGQIATLQAILRGAPMDTITTNIGNTQGTQTRPDNSGFGLLGSIAGALIA